MTLNAFVAKNAPTACKGLLLSIGMSGAVIFGVAMNAPDLSSFAAFGSMLALNITPRHGAIAKIFGAFAGCLFLLLAACLGVFLSKSSFLALVLLFFFSWLAALPKKDIMYISFVVKFAAIAVLLNYFDFSFSLPMGLYFCGGLLLGLFLSLAATAFETENEQRPIDQLRKLLHGDINSIGYSLTVPVTVVISSLIAANFSYANPAWVGLTVIFVSNSDPHLELKRAFARITGTIAGTVLSYFILDAIQLPLRLALIVGVLAFFLPFVSRRYSLFSLLITCIVLILINIAMFAQGGDMDLLLWRSIDTVFGCGCVMVANILMRFIQRKSAHE
ncbi:MAG: FUSC family protein [Desulfovibrio sp.]|nr:FUSC family protein [Desulfovibrio sp.]